MMASLLMLDDDLGYGKLHNLLNNEASDGKPRNAEQ